MRVVGKLLKHAAASLYMQTKKKEKKGLYIYTYSNPLFTAPVL